MTLFWILLSPIIAVGVYKLIRFLVHMEKNDDF